MSKYQNNYESKDTTNKRFSYYDKLGNAFEKKVDSSIDKLLEFPKYAPNTSIARFLSRYEVFKKVLDIPGNVIECGVLSGGGLFSFAHISTILEPYNQLRKIIGFDTFEGFPSISEIDKEGSSKFLNIGSYSDDCYDELLELSVIHNDFRLLNRENNIEIVKGDICSTVPEYVKKNPQLVVSLLFLDVDLYEPTKVALEYFVPRMPKGALIAFDELNYEEFPGETVAVNEVLGIQNLKLKKLPFTKLSYVIIE